MAENLQKRKSPFDVKIEEIKEIIDDKKAQAKKPKRPSSASLTIIPEPKPKPVEDLSKEKNKTKEEVKVEEIVRPTPKKTKAYTKEEKQVYKKLDEAFSYIVNLTRVVEEKTNDNKAFSDLSIGEIHVIEMVSKNNNKPMSLIANKLKVTVGSLITCVNRLVQKEYLLRIRDEMDHRVILLCITPKSKKMLKVHDKFHEDIIGLALENLNLNQAAKVMSQFMETLEVYYDPTLLNVKKPKERKKK